MAEETVRLKRLLQAPVRVLVDDYWNGWLYTFQPKYPTGAGIGVHCGPIEDVGEISRSRYEEVRAQALTPAENTWAFGAWVESELAAVCWFQARETRIRRGAWFDLAYDEAELAQITTASPFRARGIATRLIQHAAAAMGTKGFRKLYAKIWRGNFSSSRAFERAGWKLEKSFLSLRLRLVQKRLMFTLPG